MEELGFSPSPRELETLDQLHRTLNRLLTDDKASAAIPLPLEDDESLPEITDQELEALFAK